MPSQRNRSMTSRKSADFSLADLKDAWSRRYALLTTKEKVVGCIVVLLLWGSNSCLFFGLNLWLWSFHPAKWSNYISIFLPSVIWAVGYLIPTLIWKACFVRKSENWSFIVSKKSAGILFAIGVLDSLGGLFAVYAAKQTPMFLQTMLMGTGPIWTFLLTKKFYPERARPFTIYPAIAFTLLAVGVITSGAHQFSHITLGSPWNLVWCFLYLVSMMMTPLYNTLQGKYLYTFADVTTTMISTRLIVLTGDAVVQAVMTTLYFPLDATPWFGTEPYSLTASWDGLMQAFECVSKCDNNAGYMMIYVGAFYVNHIIGAVMNHYSPTLMAVVGLVSGPINVGILILVPALQISGAPGNPVLQIVCFICTIIATVMFVLWEESVRFLQNERAELVEVSLPLIPSSDEDFPSINNKAAVTTAAGSEGREIISDVTPRRSSDCSSNMSDKAASTTLSEEQSPVSRQEGAESLYGTQ